jgi:hypothetical protein
MEDVHAVYIDIDWQLHEEVELELTHVLSLSSRQVRRRFGIIPGRC